MTEIHRFEDGDRLATGTAKWIVAAGVDAIETKGRFDLALTGDFTLLETYRRLPAEGKAANLPWQDVHVFWSDERCVPTGDAENHFRMADTNFLSQVPIPDDNINPITCNADPGDTAKAYERILRDHFGDDGGPGFDVVLLGLTAEGQAGALKPDSELLTERDRWVVSGFAQDVGEWRISLSPRAINGASNVVFVVQGKEKIEAVRKSIQAGDPDPGWPASYINPVDGEVHWFSDEAAALLV